MSTAVVIVNFKTYEELTRCLASLAPELAADDEVVVVDYESEPDRLAQAAAAAGRAVMCLPRRDNLGFAAGVNLGAAQSRARYLMLLNPDAVIEGPVVRTLEVAGARSRTQRERLSPGDCSSRTMRLSIDSPSASAFSMFLPSGLAAVRHSTTAARVTATDVDPKPVVAQAADDEELVAWSDSTLTAWSPSACMRGGGERAQLGRPESVGLVAVPTLLHAVTLPQEDGVAH